MAYIDTKHLFQCTTCKNHNKSGCATLCDHGEQYIPDMKKIPTADVEEVRHGEWEQNIKEYRTISGYKRYYVQGFKCSLCGNAEIVARLYCPNCGAKMDGSNAE